jgi:hypothetical protein
MVMAMGAPRRQCALILPNLIRQQQVVASQALEAVDEDATAQCIEFGPQGCRQLEVLIPMSPRVWTSKNKPIMEPSPI